VTANDRVMLFDEDAQRAASIADALDSMGLTTIRHRRERDALTDLLREGPSVAVVVGGDAGFPGLTAGARASGISTLAVIDPGNDPRALAAAVRDHDGWASLSCPVVEIAARVAGLLEQRANPARPIAKAGPPLIDARFLGLVVHDLRTPLNVIVLALGTIAHSVSRKTADFEEDLMYLTENTRQIEKMLLLLGDYCRLIEAESDLSATEFNPRRFLKDFLEDHIERSGVDPTPVRLELTESCPREVALDPIRVALALKHALTNTVAAAGDSPVRLRASGKPGRLIIEMIVDGPPAETVSSIPLRADSYARLVGVAAERRGPTWRSRRA
jgi:signal transduction histidine kinase